MTFACGISHEYLRDDLRFLFIDQVPLTVRGGLDSISKGYAAGGPPLLRLVQEVLVRTLAYLFALQLAREVACGDQEFVGRALDANKLVGEVVDELHARVRQVLDNQAGANHISTEPRLVSANPVRELALRRVEQAEEARPLLELAAADRVVDIGRADLPPLRVGVPSGLGGLHLQGRGLVLIGTAAHVERYARCRCRYPRHRDPS